MSTLADQQSRFQAYVLEDAAPPLDLVMGSARADAETLLGVYRDAYSLRLLEALGEDYPALARLLGAQEFERMGRAYIAAHRSRHRSIRWYGQALATFLEREAPWRADPALAELAAWEWALGEAMDAADADTIESSVFAQVPPERWSDLRFIFHPSLRRLDLSYPVPALRQALEEEARDLPALTRSAGPLAWAIWRNGIQVFFRSLEPDEARALDAARNGATFGAVCDMLAQDREASAAAASAAGFLKSWTDAGWIAKFDL